MINVNRRRLIPKLLACAALLTSMQCALADTWPSRPITLVIPFASGGTTDIIGRMMAQKLGEALHQPVIVDNRPGAGGTVAAGAVARASADGYTLFLSTIAHAIAPGIYKKLPYDFTRDFDPIGLVALTPNVLLVNPSVPAKSVPELISYIKAHPGKINFGSAGVGSTEHLSGELFRSMTGTTMSHVPYKGGAPMMTDLIAGQIQMAIETSPSAEPHVRSGEVRALAVSTLKRSAAYPGVPTLDESGVKGYDVTTWFALMTPHGTPADVQARLSSELSKVLQQPEMVKRFAEQGVAPGDMNPKQLGTFIRNETTKWTKVAKESGASAD